MRQDGAQAPLETQPLTGEIITARIYSLKFQPSPPPNPQGAWVRAESSEF